MTALKEKQPYQIVEYIERTWRDHALGAVHIEYESRKRVFSRRLLLGELKCLLQLHVGSRGGLTLECILVDPSRRILDDRLVSHIVGTPLNSELANLHEIAQEARTIGDKAYHRALRELGGRLVREYSSNPEHCVRMLELAGRQDIMSLGALCGGLPGLGKGT